MPQVEFYSIESRSDPKSESSSDTKSDTRSGSNSGSSSDSKSEAKPSKLPIAHIVEVITRGYRKGQKIFINAESKYQAELLDEKLWTQDAKSFLPHQLVGEDENTKPPIEIGFGQNPSIRADILINLADEAPAFYQPMKWIFEYAYGDEEKKEKARAKFRFYRQQNCLINHKKISG